MFLCPGLLFAHWIGSYDSVCRLLGFRDIWDGSLACGNMWHGFMLRPVHGKGKFKARSHHGFENRKSMMNLMNAQR